MIPLHMIHALKSELPLILIHQKFKELFMLIQQWHQRSGLCASEVPFFFTHIVNCLTNLGLSISVSFFYQISLNLAW